MSNFPCPTKSNCDCSDDPFANLTAEGFDQRGFFSIVHTNTWLGQCCTKVCESVVSQEAADACAQIVRMVAEQGGCDVVQQSNGELTCADPTNTPTNPFRPCPPGSPDCPGTGDGNPDDPNSRPPINYHVNTRQTASKTCPGGWVYYDITDDSGFYAGESQIEADRIAQSFAQIRVNGQNFCAGTQTMIFCADEFDLKTITITGGTAPFTWTFGTLPPGLFFSDESGDGRTIGIVGIPTAAGVSTISVMITSAANNVVIGTFQIAVVDIIPDPLPDATIGVAYPTTQLICDGLPFGMVAAFEVVFGALPDGLTMTNDGIISGTPTAGLPASFSIAATFL